MDPLDEAIIKRLSRTCGSVHAVFERSPFGPAYRQRIQLYQPSQSALALFVGRDGVQINFLEVALDWVFDDGVQLDEARDFVGYHLLKAHHRDQGVRWVGGTRYTGPRSAPNLIVTYADKPCRVTGEVYCLHIDWRINGLQAVRSAGVSSVADVLSFNHRAFWARRLRLARIDTERLGRLYNNSQSRSLHARRTPWIERFGSQPYNVDRRAGATIERALGSVQAVVDAYRKRFAVSRALVQLNIEHLLPASSL